MWMMVFDSSEAVFWDSGFSLLDGRDPTLNVAKLVLLLLLPDAGKLLSLVVVAAVVFLPL